MKIKTSLVLLFFFLAACAPVVATSIPTETPVPSVVPPILTATVNIPAIITPSPLPTQPIIPPFITPDAIQVARWKEYEAALAKKLFPSSFTPGQFLCEWEILGQSNQEVYVWAVCMSVFSADISGFPYHSEMPSVIHVGVDGAVQSVEIPGGGADYAADIRRIFPPGAQERIFGGLIHSQELREYLKWRREHPEEPPLIVFSATPTPAPVPTQPIIPLITPDAIQVERWREYQAELAKLVLSDSGAEFPLYEDALCEWDILGHSNQEVYVWAVCATPNSLGEKPAVIHLETDGSVRDVKVVFHGSSWDSRIRELFPIDVQEKIYLYSSFSPFSGRPLDLRIHLGHRLKHPEVPPLIVVSAMTTVTPVP